MKFPVEHVLSLLKEAASKAGTTVDHGGLQKLSYKMEDEMGEEIIKHKYLYDTVFMRSKKNIVDGKSTVSLNKGYIDTIAKYVGHEDFDAYLKSVTREIPSVLLGCIGNWYSYVRDSSGENFLLRSPVRIFQEGGEIKVELIGGWRKFYGTVGFRSGGIFFLLTDTAGEKEMHEVYRVGILQKPDDILSGVFSALSSRGIPVAGRKVLYRVKDKAFDELQTGKIALPYISEDEDWPQNVVDFFEKYEDNYIMVLDTRVQKRS